MGPGHYWYSRSSGHSELVETDEGFTTDEVTWEDWSGADDTGPHEGTEVEYALPGGGMGGVEDLLAVPTDPGELREVIVSGLHRSPLSIGEPPIEQGVVDQLGERL